MTFLAVALLASLSLASAEQLIDDFHYPDDQTAQQTWVAQADGGAPSIVSVVTDGERSVLRLIGPFATQPDLERVYVDRAVDLNLASAGELLLELKAESAAAATARVSLYCHSQNGWYAAGGGFASTGWNTLRFSKASFRVEGQPQGWHQIDRVRIAIWRGQAEDSSYRIGRLSAAENQVALIIPGAASDRGRETGLSTATELSQMIADLGLGSDAIEDSALTDHALGSRRVAILAYNPNLSQEAIDELVRFVERGGRLFACYQLPEPLAESLGFENLRYRRQEHAGQFAEIRFDANAIDGLPAAVRQASWNITTAEPVAHGARVVGRWYDQLGHPTNQPALLISDRGAFFSHIILPDDHAGKQRMIAAILGHLAPELWKQMAETQLARAGRVGHCSNLETAQQYLRSRDRGAVTTHLESATNNLQSAQTQFDRQEYRQAADQARAAHEQFVQAYLLAQPSPVQEARAIWNHSGTGAYDGDWDRTARELTEAGFNMVMPNMLWGGRAHYPSDLLPRSETYKKWGDQLAQCTTAARKYGLEVHVWKVNFNLSGAPQAFVQMIHREKRNQVSVDGQTHDWLCPSHPDNQQLELASMLEVVATIRWTAYTLTTSVTRGATSATARVAANVLSGTQINRSRTGRRTVIPGTCAPNTPNGDAIRSRTWSERSMMKRSEFEPIY